MISELERVPSNRLRDRPTRITIQNDSAVTFINERWFNSLWFKMFIACMIVLCCVGIGAGIYYGVKGSKQSRPTPIATTTTLSPNNTATNRTIPEPTKPTETQKVEGAADRNPDNRRRIEDRPDFIIIPEIIIIEPPPEIIIIEPPPVLIADEPQPPDNPIRNVSDSTEIMDGFDSSE